MASDELPEVYGDKSAPIKDFLEELFPGAAERVRKGDCVGCDRHVTFDSFRDNLSRKEYGISGLCQLCQDKLGGVA